MNEYKIELSENSIKDIKIIYRYIADILKEPNIAKKQKDRITKKIMTLEKMPERNPFYNNEFGITNNIRFVPIDNYLIFYKVNPEQKTVYIVRVLYARRKTSNLL